MRLTTSSKSIVATTAIASLLSISGTLIARQQPAPAPSDGIPNVPAPADPSARVETPPMKLEIPIRDPGASATKPIDPAVDDLLRKLEAADKDLASLTAQIQYTKFFPEIQGGGEHVWQGTLKFKDFGPVAAAIVPGGASGAPGEMTNAPAKTAVAARSVRGFRVDFITCVVDGAKRDEQQQYIFDGQWLLTLNPPEKQFTRHEIAIPGSNEDPLRIGEGPLPLPIGQKRDDMVARFDLAEPPVLENIPESKDFEGLRKLLGNCRQLRLTPRTGGEEARNFRQIRLWYRTSDYLPVFAQTSNTDDSRGEVLLVGLVRNPALDKADFSTKPPKDWKGEERARGRPAPPPIVPMPAPKTQTGVPAQPVPPAGK